MEPRDVTTARKLAEAQAITASAIAQRTADERPLGLTGITMGELHAAVASGLVDPTRWPEPDIDPDEFRRRVLARRGVDVDVARRIDGVRRDIRVEREARERRKAELRRRVYAASGRR